MTKKILALALALCMVVALAACGSSSNDSKGDDKEENALVGEWTVASVEVGGQKVEGDALAGYEFSYIFKDDGTASVSALGETVEYKYTFKDNEVTFPDDSTSSEFSLKLVDSNLVMEYSDMDMKITFEKK
jgi:uncharacterized lipoprotein YehR (DUF1307 family)